MGHRRVYGAREDLMICDCDYFDCEAQLPSRIFISRAEGYRHEKAAPSAPHFRHASFLMRAVNTAFDSSTSSLCALSRIIFAYWYWRSWAFEDWFRAISFDRYARRKMRYIVLLSHRDIRLVFKDCRRLFSYLLDAALFYRYILFPPRLYIHYE